MATTVFLEVSVGVDVAPAALEHWVFAQLNMPGLEKRFSRGNAAVREEDLDAIDEFGGQFEVQRYEPVMAERGETWARKGMMEMAELGATEGPGMGMMEMAAMEEAARESWEEQLAGGPRNEKYERIPFQLFEVGFRAGVAWARRQGHSALARYMDGGVALIATERMLQIEEKGWTPEHDGKHVNFELITAAMYYCSYDEVAATVFDLQGYKDQVEALFPSTWADSWKKRRGFPEPTDYDLAKAGALIAAELDRRARERKLNGTSSAVSVLFESQLQDQVSSQAVGTNSQYQAATEEPEEEA